MSSPGQNRAAEPPAVTPDDVLAEVRRLLASVIGEDYVAELDIEPDTTFADDLDIESIELVALGEALEVTYGERVDFPAWLASMEVEEIMTMTVGDLVDHIVAGHG